MILKIICRPIADCLLSFITSLICITLNCLFYCNALIPNQHRINMFLYLLTALNIINTSSKIKAILEIFEEMIITSISESSFGSSQSNTEIIGYNTIGYGGSVE